MPHATAEGFEHGGDARRDVRIFLDEGVDAKRLNGAGVSALALALGTSARTVQRALDELARSNKVQSFGHGRARRWMTPPVPGFPTGLLLPAPIPTT